MADESSQADARPGLGLTLLRYFAAILAGAMVVALFLAKVLNSILAPAAGPSALVYCTVVGLPVALVMRRFGWRGPVHAMAAGALLGLIPFGLLSLAEGGFPDAATEVGVGAVAALVGWLAVKVQALGLGRVKGAFRAPAAIGLAVAVVAFAYAGVVAVSRAIDGPPDLSCHNLFRNGGKSFYGVADAKLSLTEAEWPRFRAVVREASNAGGWSMREYDQEHVLAGSLCQEIGTKITYRQWTWHETPDRVVSITVYAPEGGEAWRSRVRPIFERLEREWPGKLTGYSSASTPQN